MKIIQHNNGVVVDIINIRDDATHDNIVVVNDIPAYETRDGFNGVLMYGEDGLYWNYEEVENNNFISNEEALNIIMRGESK